MFARSWGKRRCSSFTIVQLIEGEYITKDTKEIQELYTDRDNTANRRNTDDGSESVRELNEANVSPNETTTEVAKTSGTVV